MTLLKKKKNVFLVCTLLAISLIFSSCTAMEDSFETRSLCENFVDYVILDDYGRAYEMLRPVASEENFQPLWNTMRDTLKNSESYEIQQKGWHKKWTNGISITRVLFEISTDDGKTCQIMIATTDGIDGIAGIDFLDSTEFVQKTKFVSVVNWFLSLFSLVCFAFSIWMLCDCAKRRIKRKALWIILTLCHAGIQLTVGKSTSYIGLKFNILIGITNISADRAALAVTVTALIPLGALIYFAMRKRITLPEEEKPENSPERDPENDIPKENEERS